MLVTSRQDVVTNVVPYHDIQIGYCGEMLNRIKEIREDRGLTQQELAERLNTSKVQISRLENSRRRFSEDWLRRIALVLECHPAELISEMPPALSPEEAALLALYRGMSDTARSTFREVGSALAQRPDDDNGSHASKKAARGA